MSDKQTPAAPLKRELNVFFNGWVFLTRLPAPRWVVFNDANLHHSARYFPLIGALVGAVAAGAFVVIDLFLPAALAVLGSMLAGVWITGGFHEDGLADTADAFGGGHERERVLAIMKDSRLGSFGALALFFVLTGKFAALNVHVHEPRFWLVLIAGHAVSRLAAVTLLYTHAYVRDPSASKSGALAERMSRHSLLAASALGLTPVAVLALTGEIVPVIAALGGVALTGAGLARYFQRRIGGVTGDCLGCLQQVAEVTFYILLIARP